MANAPDYNKIANQIIEVVGGLIISFQRRTAPQGSV